jgi:uncharacterized RDD family membrane protein YckC
MIIAMHDPTRVIWRRCFAYATSLLLTGLVLAGTLYVAGDVHTMKSGCPRPVPTGRVCVNYRTTSYLMQGSVFIWFGVALVVLVLVVAVVPQVVAGSSLGKALFRIRVVRADGSPPGFLRSAIRVATWPIDGLSLLLPIGLWLAIFTPGHRRVGDYLARTYVVERSAAGRAVPIPRRHRRTLTKGASRHG